MANIMFCFEGVVWRIGSQQDPLRLFKQCRKKLASVPRLMHQGFPNICPDRKRNITPIIIKTRHLRIIFL